MASNRSSVRADAISAIDRLLYLQEQSLVSVPAAAAGKDRRASDAFIEISHLARLLAGWALRHRVGLALGGLRPLPRLHPKVRDSIAAVQALAAVDDHRHENEGRSATSGNRLAQNNSALRLFLRGQIVSNPMPEYARSGLLEAFDALEIGEVHPVFQPRSRRPLWRHWKRGLELAAFRQGQRRAASQADSDVGEAFGVDAETVHKWRDRVKKRMGTLAYSSMMAFAETAGESELYLRGRGDKLSKTDWQELENEFGSEALDEAGKSYRQAVGQRRRT